MITQGQLVQREEPAFKKGDKVTLVNDYGVEFPGKTIIGSEVWPDSDGTVRYFIEPTDCPWFSRHPRNLVKEG